MTLSSKIQEAIEYYDIRQKFPLVLNYTYIISGQNSNNFVQI